MWVWARGIAAVCGGALKRATLAELDLPVAHTDGCKSKRSGVSLTLSPTLISAPGSNLSTHQASTKEPPSPLTGDSISISNSQWSLRGSLLSCTTQESCGKTGERHEVNTWKEMHNTKQQKLTQAVAIHVPQSAYVSMVMLDRAVRISGHKSSQRLSTYTGNNTTVSTSCSRDNFISSDIYRPWVLTQWM